LVIGAFLVLLAMQEPIAPLPAAPDEVEAGPGHPYLRTAVEELLLLGGGATWYWRHPSENSGDLKFTWNDWRSKLLTTNELSFDDDLFSTNAIAHPLAGLLYYQIARGNGLSPLASLVATIATSTVWEYFVEWDERPSANDLVFTPAGGAVLGEATYRLGRMFAEGSPSLGNCLGALIFSPVATLTRTPVCRRVDGQPTDDFGLPSRTWHKVTFGIGQAYISFDSGPVLTAMDFGFGAAVVDHDGYRRPGHGWSSVSPGAWTAFSVSSLINSRGLRGLETHAEGTWWGRYFRDYAQAEGTAPGEEAAARRIDGRGLMLGLGSTFDYDARDVRFEWDRVVTVGLAGPMLEYVTRHGALTARAAFTAQYGFAMVTSLAYTAAAPSLATQIIKTSLEEQGYYYAQSLTSAATLSLEDEPLSIYLRARLGAFWSIDRGDRFQSQLTNNFSLHDRRLHLRAAGTLRILGGPLRLILAFDQINRDSELLVFAYEGVERRGSLCVLAVF
jgi:hypothetical protein